MADRLSKTPTSGITWFLQCAYCKITDMGHEKELLNKAKRLCKNHQENHFLDYVTSHLDTLDHSILTPISEIEILTQIHNSLPCDCLTETTHEIDQLTKSNEYVTIPAAYAIPTTPEIPAKPKPQRPAKTLLERLQNGQNGTHKPRKI